MKKLFGALALLMALALPAGSAQQIINRGTTPEDRAGDSAYVFTDKINKNFAELYASVSTLTTALAGKAASVHTHVITDVTGLQTALNGKQPLSTILTNLASGVPLPVALGGTGGGTSAAARSGIGAAASGANSDITSLGGLTTALSAALGGTGATSLSAGLDTAFGSTRGNVLYRGAVGWAALGAGTSGQMLTTGGAGADPSWTTPSGASMSVPVRQTALSGPTSSGAPSFLPATTTGTLTLTAQNVSGTTPLIYTAAQGFGASGAVDVVYRATSNPSWTLSASTTSYLFANASTGATSVSTLAPAYIEGGTPSTTNGQFTFDVVGRVGYLGNGTTAVATPLVVLGKAVTSSTAVTSTVAYAYQGRFQSPATAFTANTTYSVAHNIGVPIEQLDVTPYAATGSTGPWLPNTQAHTGSYPYPAAGLFGGLSTEVIRVIAGASGVGLYTDNGGGVSLSTTGFFMVRAKRAW